MAVEDRTSNNTPAVILERVVVDGDLRPLNAEQRMIYYKRICDDLGINWSSKPFEYIVLNNRLTLYATRNCTDQLRMKYKITIEVLERTVKDGTLTVQVRATMPDGRSDEDFGSVPFNDKMVGDVRSNAIMKAVTKAKRRVTLSIVGLSMSDESEIESIPGRRAAPEVSAELAHAIGQAPA